MKKLQLFISIFLLGLVLLGSEEIHAKESIFSQMDTMYVDVGTSVHAYPVANILQLTFVGLGTSIDEKDLDKMNQILNSFVLHQNYPNPFNPTTNISYHLPQGGDVRICIYDVEGRMINEVLSERQEAGDHTINWNGKNNDGVSVASGMYLYRVHFNNSVITKKMILIK